MNALFESVGWNTLAAALLAALVLLVGRVWKRPELLHVLWLVVLVKLVTPALVTVEAIPSPLEAPGVVVAAVSLPGTSVAPVGAPVAPPMLRWTSLALGAWVAGSVLLLCIAAVRVRRFRRALRPAVRADPDLIESIETLARRIDVRRPRIRVVDTAVSPMVWGGLDGAMLILPMKLMRELDATERDTLLAHELAHLKRGDCWVRWIELAVTVALWWNPLVWWVRRQLRRAEEQACDRWVLELLPRARRAYADGIVKTVEFLAGNRTPALATGATGMRQIQERLTMILAPSRPGRLRRPILPALIVALVALPVIPGFADPDDALDSETANARLVELEREALDLERRLQEIHLQRAEVERRLRTERVERDALEMRRTVAELRRAGHADVAARIEAEAADMIERAMREQEMVLRDRERVGPARLDRARTEVLLQIERLQAEMDQVDGERRDEAQTKLKELNLRLRELDLESRRGATLR